MGDRTRRVRTRARSRGGGASGHRFAVLAAALAGLVVSRSTRPEPTELVIEPALLTQLQTLAEGLQREIVLCLQGTIRNETAVAREFVMPVPRLSTPTRSSFDPCPRGTLASWHNHPRVGDLARARGPWRTAAPANAVRQLCVLSETDIHTAARLRHPFVVVSVDAGTWCWWRLREVDRFERQSIAPGLPAPERLAEGGLDAAWARPALAEAGLPEPDTR